MSIVMKFGGTSVADSNAFQNVARIVKRNLASRPVVVVSAMSGVTDLLLASFNLTTSGQSANVVLEEISKRHQRASSELLDDAEASEFLSELEEAIKTIQEHLGHAQKHPYLHMIVYDEVLSFGERLSSNLLARVLRRENVAAQNVDARQCIVTDEHHSSAAPLIAETFSNTNEKLSSLINNGTVPVLGGFIGSTKSGATTTLGRGGSDYSAAIFGAALKSAEIQIWTDVTGVLTADPRVVRDAQTVERLSYAEAAELAYFGAKVLHPKTIQPAIEGSIPVRICNSREPAENGTLVCAQTETTAHTVKAIAHKKGVTTVQVSSARMLGAYGFLRALFEVFEKHRTVVDVVTTSEVSVSLSLDDASQLPSIVADLEELGNVRVEKGRAIICVVGEGLLGTPGIAANVFSTITDINVSLISQGASSINLTFAVEEERVDEVVNRLHEFFFGRAQLAQVV